MFSRVQVALVPQLPLCLYKVICVYFACLMLYTVMYNICDFYQKKISLFNTTLHAQVGAP